MWAPKPTPFQPCRDVSTNGALHEVDGFYTFDPVLARSVAAEFDRIDPRTPVTWARFIGGPYDNRRLYIRGDKPLHYGAEARFPGKAIASYVNEGDDLPTDAPANHRYTLTGWNQENWIFEYRGVSS